MNLKEPTKLFNKNSLLLIQGTLITKFGDVLYSMAIGYYVYNLTESEALLGIFTSITMFVTMIFSPFAGSIIDRINRKFVICTMDILRGFLMLLTGFLCINGNLPINVLLVLTLIVAFATVLFQPAAATILIDIVPKTEYVRASSINSGFTNVIDMISKGLSGFLLVYFGIGELIIANGISYLLSAATKFLIAIPPTPKQGSRISIKTVLQDTIDGFESIIKTKGLNQFFISAILINLFSAGYISLFLVLCNEKGFTEPQYGILMFLLSLGGFLGTLPTSLLKIKSKTRPTLMAVGFYVGGMLMFLALASNNFCIVAIGFFFGDFFNIIGNLILNSTLMLLMPIDQRATMLGFISASSIGGFAISTIIYGFLAEYTSISRIAMFGTILSTLVTFFLFQNRDLIKAVIKSGQTAEEK